jgi:cell division protein FtsL
MKNYIIKDWYFNEVLTTDDQIKKNTKSIAFVWQDLDWQKIKCFDLERDKLLWLVNRATELRFSNTFWQKRNILTLLLIIWIFICAFQWSSYKWKNWVLMTSLEQVQNERDNLLKDMWKINIGSPIIKKENEIVEKNNPTTDSLINQNNKLNDQLEFIEQWYKNQISLISQKLEYCEIENKKVSSSLWKTDLEIYQDLLKDFTVAKKEELKQIVKYEYLDEARKLAQQYCSKIK